MSLCVLFGLLLCCLACFREGVWTKYTPQDVARWQAQAAEQPPCAPAVPAPARPAVRVGPAKMTKADNRLLEPEPLEELELVG